MGFFKQKRLLAELTEEFDAHNHTSIHGTDATANNTAGGACTLQGGKGRGTGAGGSFLVQTAPAGSAGATPGTLATRLDVDSEGVLWIPNVSTAPTVGRAGHVGLFVQAGVWKAILPDNSVELVDYQA